MKLLFALNSRSYRSWGTVPLTPIRVNLRVPPRPASALPPQKKRGFFLSRRVGNWFSQSEGIEPEEWCSRAAVYKVIPQSSAIVAEVFGTAGEAYAEPTYRAGVRWESPRVIVAATYGDTFSGAGSPRLELGLIVLTNQLKFLCLGKCQKDPDW